MGDPKKAKAWVEWMARGFLAGSLVSIVAFLVTINWIFFIPMVICWFVAVMIMPMPLTKESAMSEKCEELKDWSTMHYKGRGYLRLPTACLMCGDIGKCLDEYRPPDSFKLRTEVEDAEIKQYKQALAEEALKRMEASKP